MFRDHAEGPAARQVFRAGKEVPLTRKEFELLRYLVEHQGEVITRDRLLDEVWGYEHFPTTRTVDTHILRLRQKLEQDPEHPVHILTVHGQGYKFVSLPDAGGYAAGSDTSLTGVTAGRPSRRISTGSTTSYRSPSRPAPNCL